METVQRRYGIDEDEVVRLYAEGALSNMRAKNQAALDELRKSVQQRPRAWWQTRDCPAWCTATHRFHEMRGDRFHEVSPLKVTLSLYNLRPADFEGEGESGYVPSVAEVELRQHVEHADPAISVLFNGIDKHALRLTVVEARELADCLDRLCDKADAATAIEERLRELAAHC